jgi:putative membrane protein
MGAVALRFLSATLAFAAAAAGAHGLDPGAGTAPTSAWDGRWSVEPWVGAALAVSLVAYGVGLGRLWRRAGPGHGIGHWRAAAFGGGWLMLAVALASPLDALGGRLFSAHMLQHELLMTVVAPLMVLGHPLGVWAWAMPLSVRRRIGAALHHPAWRVPWQQLTAPLAAWIVHAAALWLWHLPGWFESALASSAVHGWQHASFLFASLLFWWSVLGSVTRASDGIALASLFTTMLHTAALGALLSLSDIGWYPHYIATTAALGWDAIDDQQLGGLVMWAPAGLAYFVAGLVLAARWLNGATPDSCRSARPAN